MFNFQFWSIVLGYHFGDLQRAKRNIKDIKSAEDGSTVLAPLRQLYTGLVYMSLFRESKISKKYRRRAMKAHKQLKTWADNGAINCKYMYEMLEAEDLSCRRCSSSANVEDVISAYDKAINSVTELQLCHHMALANELAGSYLLQRQGTAATSSFRRGGRQGGGSQEVHHQEQQHEQQEQELHDRGISYMINALNLYRKWGAMAKVRDIESRFGSAIKQIGSSSA